MRHSRAFLRLSIAIGIITFAFYVGLQTYMRPYALDGTYFQIWSSETMMQTLSVEDLRRAPLQSLWHLHMQPPLLDAIRALLATMANSNEGLALVREVDKSLYVVWALAAAVLFAGMFRWLTHLTNTTVALLATLMFIFHPGIIFYATLLEGTFLSSVLIFLMYYELWKLSGDRQRSILPFTTLVISLALLRTLFQWPAILVFAASLILVQVPRQKVWTAMAICTLVLGSYLTKQYIQFGTTSTFGWRGLNICRSIGSTERHDLGTYHAAIETIGEPRDQESALPPALSRRIKVSGTPNFNHVSFLTLNEEMVKYCSDRLKGLTFLALLEAFRVNWNIYFSPSSRYVTQHELVDRLPWRDAYDSMFSSPVLPGALILALLVTILFMRKESIAPHLGLFLPGAYILLVSVIGERGENMRLKIFLEPVFYVFIIAMLYKALARLRSRRVTSARSKQA